MVNTTHNNGLSESELALTVLDSPLKWLQDKTANLLEISEENDALQALKDTAESFHNYMSKIGDGNISVLGRQKTNAGSKNANEAAALSSKAGSISTSFGLSQSFNINFIPEGFNGSSALGREFTTTSLNLSAAEAQQVQTHIAGAQQDMEGVAEQDFTAYVLAPEILDEKLKQEEAGFDSTEARNQFTKAALESHDGIIQLENGQVAISSEKLETLRGQFTQAENGNEANTQNNEASPTVTTYEYTGETSTTAFNPMAIGQDTQAPSITDQNFELLPELTLDAPT